MRVFAIVLEGVQTCLAFAGSSVNQTSREYRFPQRTFGTARKFVITREANLRRYNQITTRKDQFTSREVVVQISDSCVISLGSVVRHPTPMFASLIVRMWNVPVSRK